MLSNRLVRLIETHANALALNLAEKVQASEELRDYRNIVSYELNARVYEIYHQLGNWLLERKEQDIEHRYTAIGSRRAAQGVPLSQLIRAIVLTKQNLWEFLKRESTVDNPIELFGQHELLELLDQFFDSAIYYAAVGYEQSPMSTSSIKLSQLGRHIDGERTCPGKRNTRGNSRPRMKRCAAFDPAREFTFSRVVPNRRRWWKPSCAARPSCTMWKSYT